MSQRFPPATPSSLHTTLDAEVKKHHGENPSFTYKDADGAPIGPFAVLAYTPDLFSTFMGLGESILHQPLLTTRMRELAIYAVVAVYPTPFVEYAHRSIGRNLKPELSPEQIESACSGSTPSGLAEIEEVAYETALALAKGVGTISDEAWAMAEVKLGKEGLARIGHVVGVYIYSCSLLRLGEIPAPDTPKVQG